MIDHMVPYLVLNNPTSHHTVIIFESPPGDSSIFGAMERALGVPRDLDGYRFVASPRARYDMDVEAPNDGDVLLPLGAPRCLPEDSFRGVPIVVEDWYNE